MNASFQSALNKILSKRSCLQFDQFALKRIYIVVVKQRSFIRRFTMSVYNYCRVHNT